MIEKLNKLRRASRYFMGGGGGGGGSDIKFRQPSTEKKTVGNWYDFQKGEFNDFITNNPLLNAAGQGSLGFFNNLGSLIGPLSALQKQVPGFFSGLQNEISGIQGQIPGLQQEFQSLGNQSERLLNNLPHVNSLTDPLRRTFGDYARNIRDVFNPVVSGGGALTNQMERDVAQRTRAVQAAQGTAHGSGALGTELLNRDSARDERLARYSQMMNQAAGVQGGLGGQIQNLIASDTGLRSGLLGQQGQFLGQQTGLLQLLSGLTGQKGNLFGQQVGATQGLSQGQQALQTGGLNQLLGTSGAQTSQFSQLTNPILGYLGNLFQGNLQGSIAQSQINAQQQAAGDAKMGSSVGGALSAVGSIVGIAL